MKSVRLIGFSLLTLVIVLVIWAVAHVHTAVARPEIPTYTVSKGKFSLQAVAEGVLKAENSTPITVPGDDLAFKIGWIAEDGSAMKKGETVVRFDPTETQKQLETSEAEQGSANGRIGKQHAERAALVANLSRDVERARAEREVARTFQGRDPQLYTRMEIIESEIDVNLAQRREESAEFARTWKSARSRTEIDILVLDRKKADLKIAKARRILDSLEVLAPHDGLVVFQRNWRGDIPEVGQNVFSGMVLAELPDTSKLQAEIWILEADAGGVSAGKKAEVRVEGRPDLVIPASVKRIDALAKPRIRNVPVQYFGAILDLFRTETLKLKPGQRVQATLFIEEAPDVLKVPRQAIFEVEGKKIVYRMEKKDWVPVPITLGSSALGTVVVKLGLAAGDVIALADPTGRPASELKKAVSQASRPARAPGVPGR